ncbi:MAG: hypothetical protein O7F72_08855 [Proteobacteria bacterium]|nr:hypothetical protein [Pseudomonadota bacterium]
MTRLLENRGLTLLELMKTLTIAAPIHSIETFFLYRVSGRGVASRGSARVAQTTYATAE